MIRRNHDDVVESYRRRQAKGDIEAMVSRRQLQCDQQFASWPWAKIAFEYEGLARAASLFHISNKAELERVKQNAKPRLATLNHPDFEGTSVPFVGSPVAHDTIFEGFSGSSNEEIRDGSSLGSSTMTTNDSFDSFVHDGSANEAPFSNSGDGSV